MRSSDCRASLLFPACVYFTCVSVHRPLSGVDVHHCFRQAKAGLAITSSSRTGQPHSPSLVLVSFFTGSWLFVRTLIFTIFLFCNDYEEWRLKIIRFENKQFENFTGINTDFLIIVWYYL
ncbi:uncharacterized protein LOC143205038 [Rhynchophorus ferrugineus]|uniref:uncharacterized protein LOC143205038 n=1 Tax=Rhynchophorus ferrugineus TaxID=354439 RepID=UPI003FCCE54E